MDSINKTALRAAVLIHSQLAGSARGDVPLYLPDYGWINIQRIRRQIDVARRYGWYRAATRLNKDLASAIDECRRQLENAHRNLQSSLTKRQLSSVSDIYRDILALRDEFEEVEIDMDEHTLSATTDRIVLEDLSLGAFEIKLDWQHFGSSPAYRVVALDPNRAARNDDVTHPHVQDEQLCEGEGRTAIQAALAEGRFFDFFMLVSQILHTYGKGSAYVEVTNWFGVPCSDCGSSVDDNDRYYCQRCDETLCDGCAVACHDCGEHYCAGCISTCAACGCDHCSSCLATCSACRKEFCDNCMEAGLCRSCHDKQRNQEKDDDSPQDDADQQPTDDSRRSGQRRPACTPA